MVGTYDNNHDEGHDIYLCIFTDRAKDDRCENKIITTLIMPVQDFSIQGRHCFEDKYKYNVYNIEEMHMSKNLCVILYAM